MRKVKMYHGYKVCGRVVPLAGREAHLIAAISWIGCDYCEHQDDGTIEILGHCVMPLAVVSGLEDLIEFGTINVSTDDGESNYCYTFRNGSYRKDPAA